MLYFFLLKMATRKAQLTVGQRSLVVDLKNQGQSYGQIAKATGFPRSTIISIVKKAKIAHTVKDLPGRGRKRKTSARIDREIVMKVEANRRLSAVQVARELEQTKSVVISPKTVCRRLHEAEFQSRTARKKPFLTTRHMRARYQFAQRHKDKPPEFWRKILWSDESKFNLVSSDGPIKVWRKPGEEYKLSCARGTVKFGGGNVMIWGCMAYNGLGRLEFIDDRMNAEHYCRIMDNNLFQSADQLQMPPDFVFQQDNDSKHTARITTSWFNENGVHLLKWPAQSPDLNPIEHLWYLLDLELGDRRFKTKDQLKAALTQAWGRICVQKVRNLIDSMPRRIKAVIKAKGGPTKY